MDKLGSMEDFTSRLRDGLPLETETSAQQQPELSEADDGAPQDSPQGNAPPTHAVEPELPASANVIDVQFSAQDTAANESDTQRGELARVKEALQSAFRA